MLGILDLKWRRGHFKCIIRTVHSHEVELAGFYLPSLCSCTWEDIRKNNKKLKSHPCLQECKCQETMKSFSLHSTCPVRSLLCSTSCLQVPRGRAKSSVYLKASFQAKCFHFCRWKNKWLRNISASLIPAWAMYLLYFTSLYNLISFCCNSRLWESRKMKLLLLFKKQNKHTKTLNYLWVLCEMVGIFFFF